MTSISESKVIAAECPICMETIEGPCNRVVTECGHAFHCSCLMQNAAHNGFNCPYCRTKMADEPMEEEDDDDYDDDDLSMSTVFEEESLTTFRMFQQQLNGEEVEEETVEEWEEVEETSIPRPDSAYIAQKLSVRGITFEDLVMNTLYQEHSNFGEYYDEYDRRSSEVYGQFKAIISQYRPPTNEPRRLRFEPSQRFDDR